MDVNVLLYAHREELPLHPKGAGILRSVLDQHTLFAVSDLIFAGFIRVACHRRTFNPPTPVDRAEAFIHAIRAAPNAVSLIPGPRQWSLFMDNLKLPGVRGEDAWDAYLAALAMEADCSWISFDQGFKRFPGLKWINPLKAG